MPLDMEEELGPGDFVLDGDPAPPSPKRGGGPSPIFGPCPLWPNGWMDQDGSWHGRGPWPGHIVLDGEPAPLPKKGAEPTPIFDPIFIVAKLPDESRWHLARRWALVQATLC